jgi:hypothetical protein
MKQKPWPYWVKGALIFGIIFLPLFFLNENTYRLIAPLLVPIGLLWFFIGLPYVISWVNTFTVGTFLDHDIFRSFLLMLYTVFVGALIGWIYGELKNRKQSPFRDDTLR